MKQPETKFKERVQKDLKTLPNCWFIKTQERGRRGVPDILICLKGQFIAIELKTDTGRLDKLQEITLSKINDAGGTAFPTTPSRWEQDFHLLSKGQICK